MKRTTTLKSRIVAPQPRPVGHISSGHSSSSLRFVCPVPSRLLSELRVRTPARSTLGPAVWIPTPSSHRKRLLSPGDSALRVGPICSRFRGRRGM